MSRPSIKAHYQWVADQIDSRHEELNLTQRLTVKAGRTMFTRSDDRIQIHVVNACRTQTEYVVALAEQAKRVPDVTLDLKDVAMACYLQKELELDELPIFCLWATYHDGERMNHQVTIYGAEAE